LESKLSAIDFLALSISNNTIFLSESILVNKLFLIVSISFSIPLVLFVISSYTILMSLFNLVNDEFISVIRVAKSESIRVNAVSNLTLNPMEPSVKYDYEVVNILLCVSNSLLTNVSNASNSSIINWSLVVISLLIDVNALSISVRIVVLIAVISVVKSESVSVNSFNISTLVLICLSSIVEYYKSILSSTTSLNTSKSWNLLTSISFYKSITYNTTSFTVLSEVVRTSFLIWSTLFAHTFKSVIIPFDASIFYDNCVLSSFYLELFVIMVSSTLSLVIWVCI